MSEEELRVVDSSPKSGFPQVLPQPPALSSDKAAWSGISLDHWHQPAGETPEHSLNRYVVTINIGQNCQVEQAIEGRLRKGLIFRGAVGLCPIHLPHWYRWDREVNILLLNLEPELLIRNASELLETDQVELVPHFAIQDSLIQQIGLALKTELQSNGSGSRLYTESIANALAIHLLRHHSTQPQSITTYVGGLPKHRLKLVTDYINDYLERELRLNELAAIAQLSSYYFSRAFKQSMGLSPHQYVIQQRVERAKQLLLQGKMRIAEVALACGFSHQSHLNRHFKCLTGVTPKAFPKS